jgi:uncharacterized membrane protein YpjA
MFAHFSVFFTNLVQETPLSYWLLEPDIQGTTVFLALNLCCLVWYLIRQENHPSLQGLASHLAASGSQLLRLG